ncbi:hypothetical protein [Streptomyces sp. NPDC050585]|uniref:hypothetical protein n=1 Tax=Streptomyces sp. NPDC050585 TaxID=3365632 RepID=UPI0037B1DA73
MALDVTAERALPPPRHRVAGHATDRRGDAGWTQVVREARVTREPRFTREAGTGGFGP